MTSFTVNFTDGSSHTYDNVPEGITEDQVRSRAGEDYSDKEVSHIASSAPTTSSTSEHPETGPSLAEKGASAIQTGAGFIPHSLTNPLVDIGLGAAAVKYGPDLLKKMTGQAPQGPAVPQGGVTPGPVAPVGNEMGVAQNRAANMTPQQLTAQLGSPNMSPQGPQTNRPMTPGEQILQSRGVTPYNAQAAQAQAATATGGPAAGQATGFIQRMSQLAERYTPALERASIRGGNFMAPAAALFSGLTSHQQLPTDPYEQARVIQQNSMPGMTPEQVRRFQSDFETMFNPKKKNKEMK